MFTIYLENIYEPRATFYPRVVFSQIYGTCVRDNVAH